MKQVVDGRQRARDAVLFPQNATHVFSPQRTAAVVFLRTGRQASLQRGLLFGVERQLPASARFILQARRTVSVPPRHPILHAPPRRLHPLGDFVGRPPVPDFTNHQQPPATLGPLLLGDQLRQLGDRQGGQ